VLYAAKIFIESKYYGLSFPSSQLSKSTPWSRDLLEKLILVQLLKKFSLIYGNRRFIAVLTRACQK
jgi:hypothetical protein